MQNEKTPQEIAREIKAASDHKSNLQKLAYARYVFIIVAAIESIGVIMLKGDLKMNWGDFWISYLYIAVFIILFLVSFKKAFLAFVIGITFYLGLNLSITLVQPDFLLQGFSYKIIILTLFFVGLFVSHSASRKLSEVMNDEV